MIIFNIKIKKGFLYKIFSGSKNKIKVYKKYFFVLSQYFKQKKVYIYLFIYVQTKEIIK